MGEVIQFPGPMADPVGDRVQNRTEAHDGAVRVEIDDREFWFSPEQFADIVDLWSETLLDVAVAEYEKGRNNDE